jgi:branched-chain amino acid transport system substrate-binding protein
MKYNEKEKFILMAVTTTPEFTQMGNKLSVRISTAFSKHVETMTEEIWKKGIRKVALYVRGFETSKRWSAHFEEIWKKKGGQIVGREECSMTASDHYSRLTKLMTTNPDAILIASFPDEPAALVVKQARELGYKGIFLFTEAMEGDQIITMVPSKDLEGSLLVNGSSALKRPEFLAFRERYKARFPDAVFQPAGPAGYEGVYMMALAMEKAGTVTDVYKIRAAFPAVVPVPDKYAAAGFTKIDPDGDMSAGSVLTEFKGGKKLIVKIKK